MWPALVAIFEKSPGVGLQKQVIFFHGMTVSLLLACTHKPPHTHRKSHFLGGITRYLRGHTDSYWPALPV